MINNQTLFCGPLLISVIGCGSVANGVCQGIARGTAGNVKVVAVYDRSLSKAEKLAKSCGARAVVSVEELTSDPSVNLVVEAASQSAVSQYAEAILRSGKDLLVLSVGALVGGKAQELAALAESKGRRIFVPAGAIVGIDGLSASETMGLDSVEVEFRKPPSHFKEDLTKFIKDSSSINGATTIFEGNAVEAVKLFPRSVNVSITAGLAGFGPERTRVKIVVDSTVSRNIITLRASGPAGEITAQTANTLTPGLGSSYLTIASVLGLLKNMNQSLVIGG